MMSGSEVAEQCYSVHKYNGTIQYKRRFGLAGTNPGDSPLAFLALGLAISTREASASSVSVEQRWLGMKNRAQIETG